MRNKHKYWHGLEILLLVAGSVVLSGVHPSDGIADTRDAFALDKDTLRCVISLSNRLGSQEAKGIGFNYEMLNHFGDFIGSEVEIRKAEDGESLLDSLR